MPRRSEGSDLAELHVPWRVALVALRRARYDRGCGSHSPGSTDDVLERRSRRAAAGEGPARESRPRGEAGELRGLARREGHENAAEEMAGGRAQRHREGAH